MGKMLDLTGKVFGKLTILGVAEPLLREDRKPIKRWQYQCSCGKMSAATANAIVRGSTSSCGCSRSITKKKNLNKYIGQTFGRLTLIALDNSDKYTNTVATCKCACGNIYETRFTSIYTGNTKSCGCLQSETTATNNRNRRKDPIEVSENVYFNSYRKGASLRKLEWGLNLEDFRNLIYQNCHYCGTAPRKYETSKNQYLKVCFDHGLTPDLDFAEKKVLFVNGIDRINNLVGYDLNNTVSCCTRCNIGKGDLTIDEWSSYLNQLVKYRSGNG